MKRIKSSLSLVLLLITATAADPGFNINTESIGPGVQARKVEELEYGVLDAVSIARRAERAALDASNVPAIAPVSPLDVNSLLNAAGQGQGTVGLGAGIQKGGQNIDANALLNDLSRDSQGQSGQGQIQGVTGANAGNVDSLVGNLLNGAGTQPGAASLDQILQGLENQKGQADGIEIIQFKETIVQQINGGGAVKETIIESADGAKQTSVGSVGAAQTTAADNTTTILAETSIMFSLLGSTQSAVLSSTVAANKTANAAITVIASSGASAGQQRNSANATSSAFSSINTAGLTQDGLVAATTTSAAGSAVTVQASAGKNATATNGGASNSTTLASASQAGVTVIAGTGGSNAAAVNSSASLNTSGLTQDGLVAATTTSNAGAAVTVQASGGNVTSIAPGLPTSSISTKATGAAGTAGQLSAITVVASNNTAGGAAAIAPGLPTSSVSTRANSGTAGLAGSAAATAAPSAVTVIAGNGNGTQAAAAANQCHCACTCPPGAFPMAAPQAAPFQLMPAMGSMSQPSTLATQVATVIAGGSSSVNSPEAAISSTIAGVSSSSSSSSSSSASAVATTIDLAATTPVPAQSQVAGSPPSTTATLQNNRLPFDISTIELQSKVTVNLGARAAPTERRRWLF